MPPRKPKPANLSPEQAAQWWNVAGHIYTLAQSSAGRVQLGIYLTLILLTAGVAGLYDAFVWSAAEPVTPDEFKMGWDEKAAKAEAPRIAAMMPKFAILDAEGNQVSGAGKSAELWKYTKLANGGKHIATWRQESGDCVSMGVTNAISYRMAFQIAHEQRNEVLKIPFPPYSYGGSRVNIGKRQLGRGAGSIGAWGAQWAQSGGVYTVEQAALDGYVYSGSLADKWGWDGPPKKTVEYGQKFRIRTIAPVTTWEDCCDALVHGYPVTVASNVGFTGPFVDRDGKKWGSARGNWAHQMCFIGCEDRPGREKGCYVINSWGANAHPKPLNDEPPGGFWVSAGTVARMVGQGDSWAYSDFDGFPAAEVDWQTFKEDVIESGDQAEKDAVVIADEPEPEPVLKEVRKMHAFHVSLSLLAIGSFLGLGCLFYRSKFNGKRLRNAATILIALSLLGASLTAEAGARRAARFCRDGQCATAISRGSISSGGGYYQSRAQYVAPVTANRCCTCGDGNPCTCGANCYCVNGACRPIKSKPVTKPVNQPSSKPLSVPVSHVATVDSWQTMQVDPLATAVASVDHSRLTLPSDEIMPVNWNAFAYQLSDLPERSGVGSGNPFIEPSGTWNTIPVTGDEWYDSEAASTVKPVVLMYTASWCAPCQIAKQQLAAAAAKGELPFTIQEVDIDIDRGYQGAVPHFAYKNSTTSTGWAFLQKQPGWRGVDELKTKWSQRSR